MRHIKTWFKRLTATGKITTIAVVSLLSIGTIGAIAEPGAPQASPLPAVSTPAPISQPKNETKTVTETETVAFTSSTIEDSSLTQGSTEVRTAGINGTRARTFEVTYANGVETARREVASVTTTAPINEIIAKGTKAPQSIQSQSDSCPNGTYINTYGDTVCRPYESSSAPAGATAQCSDGTYSFSQSRRGTCSGHGGVAMWL